MQSLCWSRPHLPRREKLAHGLCELFMSGQGAFLRLKKQQCCHRVELSSVWDGSVRCRGFDGRMRIPRIRSCIARWVGRLDTACWVPDYGMYNWRKF